MKVHACPSEYIFPSLKFASLFSLLKLIFRSDRVIDHAKVNVPVQVCLSNGREIAAINVPVLALAAQIKLYSNEIAFIGS